MRFSMKKMPLALKKQAQLAIFLAATMIMLPTQTGAQASQPSLASTLPQLGDGNEMTSSAERRLGDRIARELYRDPDFIDDPVLGDYVQGIWQPLLAAARLRGDLTPELDERFAWRIVLGRDRSVNAFALPGGYLGVHLGLIAVVSSRDELASVLGHELSHVTQRHIARLMSKNSQQTPWMIGAMILGALAASKNAETGNALIVGGQALSTQAQLNFSRDMEREADRVGFGVMTQAGFQAQGFVSMFDKLQQASRLNDSGAYPYLRSHPLTTERIADMQSRLPLGTPTVNNSPTLSHAILSTRARVLSNPSAQAMQNWQIQAEDSALMLQPPAVQAGVLYGAAMAASRLREPAQARRQLARLQQLVTSDPEAVLQTRWLAVEVGLLARDLPPSKVLTLGQDVGLSSTAAMPTRRPELLLQAQVALQVNQTEVLNTVAQRLQTWVALTPNDAQAWQWLSSIYATQNQPLRALRAEAEAHMAQLDYAGALDRLKAAQDRLHGTNSREASADHIDASIIDTRRRQIEELLKEQAKEG
ncbi:beta-barrel assembly-enhancing protease [Rhodoferax lithotrophicus]|uniref:Beta-barrel assembly-enhancing protease n=2 Tax=Rhodoferax lithotrophicus TaxID=2798804 RepID=A0ABM7MHI6_9BURK|nr:beta-barrel assembly-enhancing protease [Rhodoferax sp. MIZ03]